MMGRSAIRFLLFVTCVAVVSLSSVVAHAQENAGSEEAKKPSELVFREFNTRQNGVDISNDGKTIFLLDQDKDLLLIDADTLNIESRLPNVVKHRGKSLASSPSGKHLVVEGVFGDLAFLKYDAKERIVTEMQKLERAGKVVSIARDAPLATYLSRDRKFCLFDFESGEVLKKISATEFSSGDLQRSYLTAKGGQAVFARSRELFLVDFEAEQVVQ